VLPNLDAVIATLGALSGQPTPDVQRATPHHFNRGGRLLALHAQRVLGPSTEGRRVRIMVTMPKEATDYDYVRDLLRRGMNNARINCAHDNPTTWQRMIDNIHRASAETGLPCRVFMDLAGPKIRTEEIIAPGPVQNGDHILLTRHTPTPRDDVQFQASCGVPQVFEQVAIGAAVWIDDGKIGAKVEKVAPDSLLLRVTQAGPEGEKLRAEKGINFPDTDFRIAPLSDKDLQDLDFVVVNADALCYSFVQEPSDVALLNAEMQRRAHLRRQPHKLAIIAKIETAKAVRNLPDLIVHMAGAHPFGIMIARGDLAVEIGFQRLAEVQEQMLWMAEAAHVPVIWATQVLENFVKRGAPSRAEITDAAMGERAECVMLNKGQYAPQAVTILDDVLRRMQGHQSKKVPMLRALRSWGPPQGGGGL
jgi:pyruvate kinase